MSLLEELKEMLTGWKASAVLLLLSVTAMASATFIEAALGSEAGRSVIYHAWWFFTLFGLLIANFILTARRYRLWHRRQWGTLALHWGLAAILAGAFITHFWGYEGVMRIRTGEHSSTLHASDGTTRTLPFSVMLRDFRLMRYPDSNTPSSYESDVTIREGNASRDQRIWMNNIARVGGFRLYQSSYDPDERGTILSVNHDPAGNAVTYGGYLLLCVGLIGALCQRGSHFRVLLAALERPAELHPATASAPRTAKRNRA